MSEMQWSKATVFGFIEFSHDIFSTKIDIPMNEQTSQSTGSAPASRVQNISAEHVEDIHTRYEDYLPDSIGFIAEMERWKMSSKSIFCHCRSAPVFQASHSRKRPLTGHGPYRHCEQNPKNNMYIRIIVGKMENVLCRASKTGF
jgi:hypothetical protein